MTESKITSLISRLSPWLAPAPTAYLVGRATMQHLGWPFPIAFIAAIIIECLGLTTVATTLELREYNRTKRKSDPVAPFSLAAFMAGSYLGVAIGLTVMLDIVPTLAIYAPAIFPLMSLAGVTVIALRDDHQRRLAPILEEKQKRLEAKLQRDAAKRKRTEKAKNREQLAVAPPAVAISPKQHAQVEQVLAVYNANEKAVLRDLWIDGLICSDSVASRARKLAVEQGYLVATATGYASNGREVS